VEGFVGDEEENLELDWDLWCGRGNRQNRMLWQWSSREGKTAGMSVSPAEEERERRERGNVLR